MFSRAVPSSITGVSTNSVSDISINLGDILGFTLSGTVDVTINGIKPYTVEIIACTDLNNPNNSRIGYAYINRYNTKANTWTMYTEILTAAPGTPVYFLFSYSMSSGSTWYTNLPLTGTAVSPSPGGSVSGIILSSPGNGIPDPDPDPDNVKPVPKISGTSIKGTVITLHWS
jgi:hypothetical protein